MPMNDGTASAIASAPRLLRPDRGSAHEAQMYIFGDLYYIAMAYKGVES
jgi:hypothetical protein